MSKKSIVKGVLLASTTMLLLTSNTFADDTKAQDVTGTAKPIKCYGVNSCRGKAQCGGKGAHTCAGLNACKGKGWLYMSEEQCKKEGGTKVD